MKSLISFLSMLIFMCGTIMAQQITQQFTFSLNDVHTTQNGEYDIVSLPGLYDHHWGVEYTGKPQLPAKQFKLLLPQGASATNVSLTINSEQQLSGSFYLYPVQLPVYPNFEDPPPFVDPNTVIYNSNNAYPANYILEYETSGFRDYNYVTISFIPFRYVPLSQNLYLFTNVTITINYTVNLQIVPHKLRPYGVIDETAYEYIKTTVLNSSQTDLFYADAVGKINQYKSTRGSTNGNIGFEPTELPALEGSPVHYVIITNNTDVNGNYIGNFTDKFQQFADWKIQSGSPAKVITVDVIRNAYPGVDIAEKIREFIKDAHLLWGTEYVLLGGNAPIVPVRWIPGMPTDLYYSAIYHSTNEFNDNWNGNGNTQFGENTLFEDDDCDFTPDIAVGRAPVDTDGEVDLFLKKNFTYARYSFATNIPNGDWLNSLLLLQGITFEEVWNWPTNGLKLAYNIIQDHHQYAEIHGMIEYFDNWENEHPTWCPAYYPTYNEECTTNGVPIHDEDLEHNAAVDQINQRYGIINHMDHSGPASLGLNTVTGNPYHITSSDFQSLSPTNKYSIFISGGCHTTAIEQDNYIAEQWINAPNGGVAFLGATADISSNESFDYNLKLYNTIYMSNIHNLGCINNFTTSSCPSSYQDYLYKIINLLGDPELSIYTDVPVTMNVTHNTIITAGTSDFDVTVTNFPVGKLVKVCLYKENEVHAFLESSTGVFTFNITPDTPGILHLTATCQNAEPYEATITVIQNPGVHLYESKITIIDDNGNGHIEPGEIIELMIELSNSGAVNASNISGVLAPGNPNTVITQRTSAYADIPSEQSGSSINNYIFTACSLDIHQGEAIPFELTITSDQGSFKESFFLNVKAPQPVLAQTIFATDINNDHIIDPGDEVAVTFTIYNSGIGLAMGLTGELTSASSLVNILSPTQLFGDIPSFGSQANSVPFVFTVSQDYHGQPIELNLQLTTSLGQVWELPVILTYPSAISGLDFIGYNTSIFLFWIPAPAEQTAGYNVYWCATLDGEYAKLNNLVISGFSGYTHDGLLPVTPYYYKVAAVSHSGLQGNLSEPIKAWTTLPYYSNWPMNSIDTDLFGNRTEGSPNALDITGNENLELFFTTSESSNTKGGIFGFTHDMKELYDIDNNPGTISGFYKFDQTGSRCIPAIGDLNNDGIFEIITVTKEGSGSSSDKHKVIVQTNLDIEGDGKPDLYWSRSIGGPSLRGVCLSDINGDGNLEIIAKSNYETPFYVFDSLGNNYPGWPKNFGKKGYTMPAACDLDNDGFKEIIFGCDDGIYIFKHNGEPFLENNHFDGLFYSQQHIKDDPMDSAPAFIDLTGDGYYEMIWVSLRFFGGAKGRIFALDRFGNTVPGWGYDEHVLDVYQNATGAVMLQSPVVGTINNSGENQIVIVLAGSEKIYCWDLEGNALENFPIEVDGLETTFISPLIADIDGDVEMEIVVASSSKDGGIYAFKFDGTPVVGWPLRVNSNSTPFIGDINNDGKNEIIALAQGVCHIWQTQGDADKVEWGSFRKDSYNSGIYDNICRSDDEPVTIEFNTIWDSDRKLHGNIHVEMGATFTIKSKVEMPANSKIIIKRGGKLVLDGGLITSNTACMQPWLGIEVQGNSNLAQLPFANQGMLIINGGTIENAECGIRTWKPISGTATPDPNYSGGLIIANDATFKNNIVAIEFLPYDFRNNSNFNRCSFLTNSALYEGRFPDYFVKLNSVSNVRFKGCNFTNTYASSNISHWGNGIYAYDADVLVDQICISNTAPCTNYLKSTFDGLYRGIYSLGATQQRNTVVYNSIIKNTVRGMYFSNVDFAYIRRNDFEIMGDVPGLNPGGYGLYMDASTAFAIEENNFRYPLTTRKGIGLVINEAGPDNNEVYNNLFQNLEYGTIAQGYNKQRGGLIDGLCYKCNDFINNGTDIRISPRNNFQVTAMDGIAYHQGANIPGNNLAPAGNTFTTTSNLKDISNACNWLIYYRHQYGPASLLPNPADLTTIYQVSNTTYTKIESCPSRIGTGTGKEEVKLAMEGSVALVEEAQASLDAIVDGGSTPELQQIITSSTPDEGLALRNQLLVDSPYLSDTILKTSIIKEEVLNNAMIRDVLVSNPQAAKSAQMVEMLDSRMVPMTDEMKNEVLAGQLITSAKENLEATISSYKHDVWVKFSTLCNLYANDTLHTWQSDTIGLLLAGANTPGTRYQLAFWQLFKGNPATAQQVMNNIPSEFTLDACEQSLHTRYTTLLNELIEFENNPSITIEPGTAIYEVLMQLSTSGEDKPAALSRNILLSDNLIIYEEPIKLDDGLKSMPIYKPELKAVQSQKLRLFPNPANTFITVSWNVPGQETNTLMIHDANGRQVLTRPLQGQHNEAIVDISGFVNGTYAVILSQGGKTVATETLVIAK